MPHTPSSIEKIAKLADQYSKPVALVAALYGVATSFFWFKSDDEKKQLYAQPAQLTIEKTKADLTIENSKRALDTATAQLALRKSASDLALQ